MPKKRRTGNRNLKPSLHIFCEGKKTEPNYLNGYLKKYYSGNRLLKVVKIEKTKKNTPVQLVNEAIKLKDSNDTPDKDSFWCVYDREAISKYSNKLHKEAQQNAKSRGINISITNICFEVWLLLHFSDLTTPYSDCENLLKNSSLKTELKKLGVHEYDKADNNLFGLISGSISDARLRANRMNEATLRASYETEENPHLLNPYTAMHKLLDAIDEFVKTSS